MIVGFAGALVVGLLAQTASPDGLVRRVEERSRRTTSLVADFVQTYRSSALGRELVERGTLQLKRPGRMRWEYVHPEKKTFVSDGKSFFFYVPAERQVIVREQAGEQGIAVRLLSGDGGILSQFDASADGVSGRLKLVPKKPDPELERAFLEADADGRIVGIEIWDVQGNQSRFTFGRMRENVALDDRQFRFEVPKGVAVIGG
jgi:outer membrane lipoprotein carrier protein